jgi:hypothetical protein
MVLGATTFDDVVASAGIQHERAGKALARLTAGGLVARSKRGSLRLVVESFASAARAAAEEARPEDVVPDDVSPEAAKVIRAFVKDGRLVSMPTTRSKRLVVLDLLAQSFEPGRRFSEKQVNDMLRPWHDDVAALRRYLVDDGLLAREGGEYWRIGGTVPDGAASP